MKVLAVLFLLMTFNAQSQMISGAAKEEGRKVTSETTFVLEGAVDGWATYELSIDRTGKVTGARIVGTNLKRTTAKMQIRDYLMKFTFTPGTHFPKFHHAHVKITLVKGENFKPKEIEIPELDK